MRLVILLVPLVISLGCVRVPASVEPTQDESSERGPSPGAVAPVEDPWAGAPSVRAVCEHLLFVLAVESGEVPSAEIQRQATDECAIEFDRERLSLGPIEYRRQAECMLEAATLDALMACVPETSSVDSHPGSVGSHPGGVGSDPSQDHQLCVHMIGVMSAEFGDSSVTDEEIARFIEDCTREAQKERAKIGAEEFQRQVDCVLAAHSFEQMGRCAPKK
jgi:hypothetical protein